MGELKSGKRQKLSQILGVQNLTDGEQHQPLRGIFLRVQNRVVGGVWCAVWFELLCRITIFGRI